MARAGEVTPLRRLAGWLAESPLLRRGKNLYEANCKHWNMQLSRSEKLQAGLHLILRDYAAGLFPPRFEDREATYRAEIECSESLPGVTLETAALADMQKPFWVGPRLRTYLRDFCLIHESLERCGILPPARVLEMGCGFGWTSEFLAAIGYEVTGTSIAASSIEWARKRIASLEAKGLQRVLRFEVAPMESVAEDVGPKGYYDAVLVYEALHHAFSWREAIQSAAECLKPGGWLLLCNEPNLVHTFSSYRVARLSNTHAIGLSRRELTAHMRQCGMTQFINMGARLHFWIKPHWLCGRKAGG